MKFRLSSFIVQSGDLPPCAFSFVGKLFLSTKLFRLSEAMASMTEELASLSIADEEDEHVHDQEEEEEGEEEFNLCLIGKVLTNSAVHFPSLRLVLSKL